MTASKKKKDRDVGGMKTVKCGKIYSNAGADREYYAVGCGAGDLRTSRWDILNVSGENLLVPCADGYTVTLTLYAGDAFQICHDGDWAGQAGIGCVSGVVVEKDRATVLGVDGEPLFFGTAQYDTPATAWNICLCEGRDGVYTFTYAPPTEDGEDGRIVYALLNALPPRPDRYDMHPVGDHNGWDTETVCDADALRPSPDGDWLYTVVYLREGTTVKLFNRTDGMWYGEDMHIAATGNYALAFWPQSKRVAFCRCVQTVQGDLRGYDGTFALTQEPNEPPVLRTSAGEIPMRRAEGLGEVLPCAPWIRVHESCALGGIVYEAMLEKKKRTRKAAAVKK